MAIKIKGNTVIDDNRRGSFNLVNAGAYTQEELDNIVIRGVSVGDAVYNINQEALNYWDGTRWIPVYDTSGEAEFLTPGTHNWTCPKNVQSICVVCVGGGGAGGSRNYTVGGGGGGLGWINNVPVVPGRSYKVVVGAGGIHGSAAGGNGGDSYFQSPQVVLGGGGKSGNYGYNNGGRYVGQGGGNGGQTAGANIVAHGGAGAGGYTGKGGDAHNNCAGSPGTGGGGGAGQDSGVYWGMRGNGGGGVGIYGQGADGKGGGNVIWLPNDNPNGNDWRNYCGASPGQGGSPGHNTGTNGQPGSSQSSYYRSPAAADGTLNPVVGETEPPAAYGACSGYCAGGDRFEILAPEAIYTNWIIFTSRSTGQRFEYESKKTGIYDVDFRKANDVFDVTFRSTGSNFHNDADTRITNGGKRLGLEDQRDSDYDDLVIVCQEGIFAGRYHGQGVKNLTYTTGSVSSTGCGGGCECIQGKCRHPQGSGDGGFPGGGGGQQEGGQPNNDYAEGIPGKGGGGAVRIIWGRDRAFPSINTGKAHSQN